MKERLAQRRKVPTDSIDSWANGFSFARNGAYYQKERLVDGVKYRHQMEKMMADKTGKEKEPSLIAYTDYLTAKKT